MRQERSSGQARLTARAHPALIVSIATQSFSYAQASCSFPMLTHAGRHCRSPVSELRALQGACYLYSCRLKLAPAAPTAPAAERSGEILHSSSTACLKRVPAPRVPRTQHRTRATYWAVAHQRCRARMYAPASLNARARSRTLCVTQRAHVFADACVCERVHVSLNALRHTTRPRVCGRLRL